MRSLLLLITLALPVSGFALDITWVPEQNTFEIRETFTSPEFQTNDEGQVLPKIPGLLLSMESGMPMVPLKPVHLALPAGFEIEAVETRSSNHHFLRHEVARSKGMMPISWGMNPPRVLRTSNAPDFAGDQYPARRVQVSLQKWHGVKIAHLNLYPLVVHRSGGADFADSIVVRVRLRAGDEGPTPLRPHQRAAIAAYVQNPELLVSFPPAPVTNANYDYLIVATQKVVDFQGANGLADLQKSLSDRGLTSKVVSLATIDATTGTDRIEKIRAYIQGEYKNSAIRYVLLAGKAKSSTSEEYLPSRPMWSKIKAYFGGSSWVDLEENIPADLYYANLDGSFNSNGNAKWGEPTDGDNSGDVDFLPEVTVGRVVVDSDTQLQAFVRKTLWAVNNALPKQMVLAGEMLFSEMNLYGDEYMDQLMGEATDHLYTTVGYSTDWAPKKLYDRTRAWGATEGLAALNAGTFAMINHLGHSNYTYNFRLSSSAIPGMKNTVPFFFYTQGCFAGGFTKGSFVDKLVTATNAAFAAIGNSTYGLAPEDPQFDSTKTPGASQMLHRQFIHALFTKGIKEYGNAHQESKRAFIDLKNAQEIRWVNWGATFFGDPALQLKTN